MDLLRTKKHIITASTLCCFISACSDFEIKQSQLSDALPFNIGDSEPSLGNGYDSLSQTLLDTSVCVSGEETLLQSTQVVSDMSQSLDREQIDKEFVGEVNGTPRLAFFNADVAGGLYQATNAGDFNHSIVYSTKVLTGGRKLVNAGLADTYATLTSAEVFKRCGDQYVSQINTGGRLSVVLNFVFSSATDRNKKQALNKLSGPWVKVKADIRDKVEKKELSGTLEVQLKQEGGDLSAARLDGAICDLSKPEDLDNCLETVTEMIRYAESEFVSSVNDKPAILDYVTSPVARLNFSGEFPVVPAEVLSIRRELKTDKSRLESAKNALTTSKDMSFDLSDYKAQLNESLSLIRETAKQCYDYSLGAGAVSWQNCYDAMKSYRTIREEQEFLQFGEVAANEDLAMYILNHFDQDMTLEVKVDANSQWSMDGSNFVDYAPAGGGCGASCPNPEAAKGQLLYLKDSRYEPAASQFTVSLKAGEALYFTANDTLGGFGDNKGAIKVSWQCLNCKPDWVSRPYQRLTVDANAKTETFLNADGDHQYKVFAAGFWTPGKAWLSPSAKKWFGPSGDGSECEDCVSDYHPLGALLIQERSAVVPVAYTEPLTLNLEKGRKVYFSFNDAPDGYDNNSGRMNVLVTCLTCDVE